MGCRRRHAASFLLLAALTLGACGKKGPPLPPIRIVPLQPDQFTARRLGGEVYLQFIVPTADTDGETPADLATVEVYGLTIDPLPPGLATLTDEELVEAGTLLAAIEVRPPPVEPADPDAPPVAVDDAVLAVPIQGEMVTVREVLTPETLVPVDLADIDRRFEPDDDDDQPEPETFAGLRWVAPPEAFPLIAPPPRRTYVAVGRTPDGDFGLLSPRLEVRLDDPPAPPPVPNVSYTADVVTIRWLAARGATRAVQETVVVTVPVAAPVLDPLAPVVPPAPPLLGSTPAIASAEPTTYNLYTYPAPPRLDQAPPADVPPRVEMPLALNPAPLTELELADPAVTFGVEQCYVVRTVAVVDSAPVESEASLVTCVEFLDTFPPAPPLNLAAVGTAGAVSLIWEANAEADLAGYLVLRDEAPGDTLQPLMTAPLGETTYRDTAGLAGVTYVYAVVALDTAVPPNVSEPSNRVSETPQ